jgi:hypothetical protein
MLLRSAFSFGIMILFFASCSSGSSQPREEEKDQPTISVTAPEQSLDLDPALVPTEAELLNAFRWTDQLGDNWVVFSELPAPDEGDYRATSFFVQRYVKVDGAWTTNWEYQASLDSCWCNCQIQLVEDELYIEDINRDGILDLAFFLYMDDLCDVSPMATRLVVQNGTLYGEQNGFSLPYYIPMDDLPEPEASEGFKELGTAFSMHARSRFMGLLDKQAAEGQ